MKTSRPTAIAMFVAALLVAISARAAEIGETSLVVGQGWALVRELRYFSLREGEQEMLLDDIPVEADLSSLVVHSRLIPLEVLEWRRTSGDSGLPLDPSLSITADGSSVHWRPADAGASESAETPSRSTAGPVLCRIKSPGTWKRAGIHVTYVVRDMGWTAAYQVSVRGEQAGDREPISVDLSGNVRLDNNCGRTFSNASVRLVGLEQPGELKQKEPGFLMLNEDSPLADLWRQQQEGRGAENEYFLPNRVTIKARNRTEAALVRTIRTPASRIHLLTSEDVPEGGREHPLRKFISFNNTPENKMGFPLPPGPVEIFIGGMRSHFLQEGWISHTPANEAIRIDLGFANDVRARRGSRGKSPPVAGYFEEIFGISIVNMRDAEVRVEVDEKPPLNLEWDVIRAGKAYTETGKRLKFISTIGPGGSDDFEYRLKVRQPRF
jgi:hypothetical protein